MSDKEIQVGPLPLRPPNLDKALWEISVRNPQTIKRIYVQVGPNIYWGQDLERVKDEQWRLFRSDEMWHVGLPTPHKVVDGKVLDEVFFFSKDVTAVRVIKIPNRDGR